MISPLLAAMLMSDLTPPISGSERIRAEQTRIERQGKKRDLEGLLLESMLDVMLEAEEDPDKKNGIRIIQAIKKAVDDTHELKYFADLGNGKVASQDRKDALALLEQRQKQLSEFWETHKKPEGTVWD